MDLPPTTPTPRRFLLAKRASTQTPAAPQGSQQFQSTPRFGSSSVPRPTQRRPEIDDVDEDEDGDEGEDEDHASRKLNETKATQRLVDAIDGESDVMTESQDTDTASRIISSSRAGSHVIDDDGVEVASMGTSYSQKHEWSPGGREVKRRRLSASPLRSRSPLTRDRQFSEAREATFNNQDDGSSVNENLPERYADEGEDADDQTDRTPKVQQPVFQPAPRFKPVEQHEQPDIFPEAFSPRRRRGSARYLPNGLAAQLQGWLSEVKGWEGMDTHHEHSTGPPRVIVEEVSPGSRMYLAKGRAEHEESSKMFMLAGEGKLTGLGRRAVVVVGSVVVLEEPVWDVEISGIVWTVACNWAVL